MLEMTHEEIGGFLREQEVGVLASCADGEAYATPESFGYHGGRLYFLLDMPPGSRKRSFVEETETFCFTLYTANSARDFASVMVRGNLNRLSDDGAEADIAVGKNDQFPSKYVFPEQNYESVEEYELLIDTITGRKGPDAEIETGHAPVVRGAE